MDTLVEKKEEAVENKVTTAENETPEKKMTMWDYVLKFKEKNIKITCSERSRYRPWNCKYCCIC